MRYIRAMLGVIFFWAIVAIIVGAVSAIWPWLDWNVILEDVRQAWTSSSSGSFDVDSLSQPDFVFAIAAFLVALAAGFFVAIVFFYALPLQWSLGRLAGRLRKYDSRIAFAADFEKFNAIAAKDTLIGHAWREFDETLVKPDDEGRPIQNTVRPHVFMNINTARERYFGLKMMNALPGYFVGVGLLLTFIGLVLALYKASGAIEAQNTDAMIGSMADLLHIATFKFATSIAGLFASIALSIAFRAFQIWIEGRFDSLCREIERLLLYTAPQALSVEMNATLKDSRDQLKQITQGDFFSRLGEEIGPRINDSLAAAMQPVTTSIDKAMATLSENSQSGVSQMLKDFSSSVQGSAGTELRELASTLKEMQTGLAAMQADLRGTGEDFGKRMADAADNLNRLVVEAGSSFGKSADESRASLAGVADILRQTMEEASAGVSTALAEAAGGAADMARNKLEEAMAPVMATLDDHISRLAIALSRSEAAFDAVEVRMREHVVALQDTTLNASETASAFGQAAERVRSAAEPLSLSSERMGASSDAMRDATQAMTTAVSSAVAALERVHSSGEILSGNLSRITDETRELWSSYAEKFQHIDEELARAIAQLSDASLKQADNLNGHVQSVDRGFTEAIGKLSGLLDSLTDNSESLAESVEQLAKRPLN